MDADQLLKLGQFLWKKTYKDVKLGEGLTLSQKKEGYKIGRGQIGLQDDNMKQIRDAPVPQTKKQVRSFLGLTGF